MARRRKKVSGNFSILIVIALILFVFKSCSSDDKKDVDSYGSNTKPAVSQLASAKTDTKEAAVPLVDGESDFKPIPYLEEKKAEETPSVEDFEKEIAQKHKEAEEQSQQNAQETRDRVQEWRDSDAQTRRLLSNNSGSSSSSYDSYYVPPSSYSSSSKTYAPSRRKSVGVQGYYRKDGTYVRPHTRSSPRSGGGRRRGR